jgi:F-type H+-transporting ATPase subunit alpha
VSRVGGDAQIKAMKQVAGTLRLDLAAYRSLEAFAQFGSDLDKATQNQLNRGARMVELLKQGRFVPMPVENQIIAIFAASRGYVDDLPVDQVLAFRDGAIDYVISSYSEIAKAIVEEKKITDETEAKLIEALDAYKAIFVAEHSDAATAVAAE